MTKEQLEAERLAKLRALNPVEIAKVLVHDQDARQISEAEFVDMISRHNPQPGETPAQTFSRHYEANTPDGALLRAGMQVTKAAEAARYFDLQPQFVGGAAALNVDDPSEAIAQLTRIGRQKWPTASEAEAFERAFTDPANAELAKKAYRRPSATSVYPMPR